MIIKIIKKKLVIILFAVILSSFVVLCSRGNASKRSGYNVLNIPPVMKDYNPDKNIDHFKIKIQKARAQILQGAKTKTYGYNGNILGPTIITSERNKIKAEIKNKMGEGTTVHWHGLIVRGKMDGGPHQIIKNNTTWKPHFTIDQPEATLWYHPHLDERTGAHVYFGLAGFFLIKGKDEKRLNIPRTYGVDDIPVVIQDKVFDSNNQLRYLNDRRDIMEGFHGNVILVNGTYKPIYNVKTRLIRFRLLNGSNGRVYRLRLSNNNAFYQIASDGGFLRHSIKKNTVKMSPGERVEIIIDFSKYKKGDIVKLVSSNFEILAFKIVNLKDKETEIPESLVKIKKIPAEKASVTRYFDLLGMGHMVTINGKKFHMDRINFRVNFRAAEKWIVRNVSGMGMHGRGMRGRGMRGRGMRGRGMGMHGRGMGMMGNVNHSFHVHGVQFQILSFNGAKPPENMRGWKDTILLEPGERAQIIMRFKRRGVFMIHCHILEHEDRGMMGQFEVK